MTRSEALRELGLNTGFSEKELKSAYRKKSFETHPDKGGSNEDFIRVAEAFDVLSNNSSSSSSKPFARDASDEERMRQAEEMFMSFFDEFFENPDSMIDGFIDKVFGGAKEMSMFAKMIKPVVKTFAKRIVSGFSNLLESDNVQITVNGQQMSGAEFKAWKEKMKARRQERVSSGGGGGTKSNKVGGDQSDL